MRGRSTAWSSCWAAAIRGARRWRAARYALGLAGNVGLTGALATLRHVGEPSMARLALLFCSSGINEAGAVAMAEHGVRAC